MTATDFFTTKFGRPPQTDSDKLMVAMMAEYAEALKQKMINSTVMVKSENLRCLNCGKPLKEHSKNLKLCPDN